VQNTKIGPLGIRVYICSVSQWIFIKTKYVLQLSVELQIHNFVTSSLLTNMAEFAAASRKFAK